MRSILKIYSEKAIIILFLALLIISLLCSTVYAVGINYNVLIVASIIVATGVGIAVNNVESIDRNVSAFLLAFILIMLGLEVLQLM